MIFCWPASYFSSFTPMQIVMSGSVAGALMITLRAPASRGFEAASRFCKSPDDSTNTRKPLDFAQEPARPADDLAAHLFPRQVRGVAIGDHPHVLPVDDQLAVARLDGA